MPSFRPIRDSKLVIAFSTCSVVGLLTPGSGNAPQRQSAVEIEACAAGVPRTWGRATAPAPAAAEYFKKARLVTRMRFLLVLSHRARDRVTRTRSRARREGSVESNADGNKVLRNASSPLLGEPPGPLKSNALASILGNGSARSPADRWCAEMTTSARCRAGIARRKPKHRQKRCAGAPVRPLCWLTVVALSGGSRRRAGI